MAERKDEQKDWGRINGEVVIAWQTEMDRQKKAMEGLQNRSSNAMKRGKDKAEKCTKER